jgi:Ala-tRNA(Pro) deacylase
MPIEPLRDFLNQRNARYLVIQHSPAYTAQEIAQASHVPGGVFAKTLLICLDDEPALVALPAPRRLDLPALAGAVGVARAELAEEPDMRRLFPGTDPGALPPFGHLFGLRTLVSRELAAHREIAFNAGSRTEVMVLLWSDYVQLARPELIDLPAE